MGGLAAAADLARQGLEVIVCDRAAGPGGKMRQVDGIDAGPTVFTMRWVFESLFHDAGQSLADHLHLTTAETLARHAWRAGGRLDLFADIDRSAEAIGDFSGAADARGYRAFCARAADIHATLAQTYMAAQRPSPLGLMLRAGLPGLWRTAPFRTLWSALGEHFQDPRLRQLFGRYATYVGSSPWFAPATLMLIAHVEQSGVSLVRGGMRAVAMAMQGLGERQGAVFRFGQGVAWITTSGGRATGVILDSGEHVTADAVVFNGDTNALPMLGAAGAAPPTPRDKRSLSAITWCVRARTRGFPLAHHTVFFAEDYAQEFDAVFRRRSIAAAPTVYVCAQDRGEHATPVGPERLLVLINAPPDGDTGGVAAAEHEDRTFGLMEACGLVVEGRGSATAPADFHALFPATGGALYGRVNHGPMASFARPGAASRLPGLYLAGGSVHPGAGIPMAALSGRLAAARLLQDLGA